MADRTTTNKKGTRNHSRHHLRDVDAARIARRQMGLITHRQAIDKAKLTDSQIRDRVRSRRWRRVHRGVYRLDGAPQTWEQSVLAALLAAGETAVACRETALYLLGVTRLGRPDPADLQVSRKRPPKINGANVHRTTALPEGDRWRVRGIPVTTGARTMIDVAAAYGREILAAVLDDLIAAGGTTRAEVYRRALELRNGRRGVQFLIALTEPGAEGTFRSWLERHTAALLEDAGIPPALWNHEVRDRTRRRWQGDAVWEAERVVVELDGLRFHDAPGQRRMDNMKDRRLQAAGWRVLRFSWVDVVERPDAVLADIREALGPRVA